jgi:biotin carboxylase
MENKNLVIIGASYLQLPLIKKAKEMGYTTHVFAWAVNDVGEKEADFFYPISIVEKEQIYDKCKTIGINGICSIASDLATITVNYVANQLGLNANTMNATNISTNKHLMRKAFEEHGDPSPKSYLVDIETDFDSLDIDFPAIVKPTDRSGSRGIYKINLKEEIRDAVNSAISEGFEGKALIEEFAEGQEYSVEYISFRGEHHFLALTQKHTTGAPHFIETGHLEPAPVADVTLQKVKSVVEHALNSLELTDGASHSEIKIDKDGTIKIIEIGGRMGGDCIGSDLVHYSTGIDFVKAVIDVACGKEPDLKPNCQAQPAKVVFIITEEDKNEFERIEAEEPDKILRVVDKHFMLIGKTTDSSNRAGCYIVKVE